MFDPPPPQPPTVQTDRSQVGISKPEKGISEATIIGVRDLFAQKLGLEVPPTIEVSPWGAMGVMVLIQVACWPFGLLISAMTDEYTKKLRHRLFGTDDSPANDDLLVQETQKTRQSIERLGQVLEEALTRIADDTERKHQGKRTIVAVQFHSATAPTLSMEEVWGEQMAALFRNSMLFELHPGLAAEQTLRTFRQQIQAEVDHYAMTTAANSLRPSEELMRQIRFVPQSHGVANRQLFSVLEDVSAFTGRSRGN